MLSMELLPPLDNGTTWSGVSFFFLPQHKQRLLYLSQSAIHCAEVYTPFALAFNALRLWFFPRTTSGLFFWYSLFFRLSSSLWLDLYLEANSLTLLGFLFFQSAFSLLYLRGLFLCALSAAALHFSRLFSLYRASASFLSYGTVSSRKVMQGEVRASPMH